MKKILLLSLSTALGFCAMAQDGAVMTINSSINGAELVMPSTPTLPSTGKATATGDTLYFHGGNGQKMSNAAADIRRLNADYDVPFDSGKLYGISVLGMKGFAQLYRYSSINASTPDDTTYRIIGFYSRWHGAVSASSTKKINFNVWGRGTNQVAVPNRPKLFVYGTPNTSLASVSPDAKNVVGASISNSGAAVISLLSSPLTNVKQDVYVGYNITYTWGSLAADTFGLISTAAAATNFIHQITGGGDTLASINNLVQEPGGNWISTSFHLGVTNGGDQAILPVIQLDCPTCWKTGIGGVENQNLTFHGAYPNPAVNSTNVVFTLAQGADVTIQIVDMTGKTISTIVKSDLQKGKNEIRIETSNLAAGNYIYTVETSKGGAVASQLTVTK